MMDLEQSSRVKIQGAEESIWHITFWVKGERGGNLYMYVGKCMDFILEEIATKPGTGCPSERGTG